MTQTMNQTVTQQLSRTFQNTAQPEYIQVFLCFTCFTSSGVRNGPEIATAQHAFNRCAASQRPTAFLQQPEQTSSAVWLVLTEVRNTGQSIFTYLLRCQLPTAVSLWCCESHFSHKTYLCSHQTLTHTLTCSHMSARTCNWVIVIKCVSLS